MKTLVTGSSGLLGQCLTKLLLDRGDSVTGFDMVGLPESAASAGSIWCAGTCATCRRCATRRAGST